MAENLAVRLVQNQRERDSRRALIDAARLSGDYQARQSDPAAGAGDGSGYWTGPGYVQFFTLGESALGGPDVLA